MRAFYSGNEITKYVQRLDQSSFSFSYVSGQYFYIASDFPFNHLFFKLGTKNDIAATMKVEYYGSNWNEVVNLEDETNAFFNDGFVQFTPNRNNGWSAVPDSTDLGLPYTVYDKYWLRVSFNQTLKPNVAFSYVGNKFTDDSDLFAEYPVFNDVNFLTAFASGKTNWEEQAIKAADLIIQDLQKGGVIVAPEQILDKKRFIGASVCKVAEIIFTAFGNDYIEQKKAAKEEYLSRLDLSQFNVDYNNDAILSPGEIVTRQNWLQR